eukprot:4292595-Pleurochrysis_carterae.AAC.1
MTPVGGDAEGKSGARSAHANSDWSLAVASGSTSVSLSVVRTHNARPLASKVKATSPPSRAKSALRAASATAGCSSTVSEAASAARESAPRRSGFAEDLSPLDRLFGQSLCQWAPLHQRQGAHLSLHFSLGSGRGRFGSEVFARSSLPRTAKACA